MNSDAPRNLLDRLNSLVLSVKAQREEAIDIIEVFRAIITEYCSMSDEMFNLIVFGDSLGGRSKYQSSNLLNELMGEDANVEDTPFSPSKDHILHAAEVLEEIINSKVFNLIINTDILEEKVDNVLLSYFIDRLETDTDIDREEIINKYVCREIKEVDIDSIKNRLLDNNRLLDTNSLINLIDMMSGNDLIDRNDVVEKTLLGELTPADNDVTAGGFDGDK